MFKGGDKVKPRWIILITIALFVGIFSFAGCSTNQESEKQIISEDETKIISNGSEKFRIAAMDYPPIEFVEEGEFKGAGIEVIREVMKRMGYKHSDYEIVEYPWSRIIEITQSGSDEIDMVLDIYETTERSVYLDFSTIPYMYYPQVMITRKTTDIDSIETLEDLRPYTVGTVKHYSYGPEIDNAIKDGLISIEEVFDSDQNLTKLVSGRVEIVIEGYYNAVEVIQNKGYEDDLKIVELPVDPLKSYVAFPKSKQLDEFRKKYDKTMTEMSKDGTIKEIFEKYYDENTINIESMIDY